MITANSVMRHIWSNVSEACGEELTINRNFLYSLLLRLEKEQFESGYTDGYIDRGLSEHNLTPCHTNFKDVNVEWADTGRNLIDEII